MQATTPFPKQRWLRILLQILLAIITLALIFFIMLPAFVAPKH